ncbi:MAG: MFS transporter [Gemmatimonadaceae bacterium]|nr:MFS transporter [Acetobacteraceae bacterium]
MDLETRTIARVTWRLVPFLIVCYFIAYLDRVNVGFAALTMNKDLGISATAYGLGAGIFFISYFLFEVPSNLFLERFGARKWIARIMLSWGLLSGATAFVTGANSFFVVRFLLSIAEAGFFPGIIFYLTLWFPAAYRARIVGYFMVAIPLSSVLGGPVSGWLLGFDGVWGLKGWQWLFIIEAAPAVLLSGVVFYYLTDRPSEAKWLGPEEREWLTTRLDLERRQRESARHYSIREALLNPKVLALSLVYFGVVACLYGIGFFLPQIVKGFGLTNLQTGFVTAIPYAVGTVAIVYWGRRSDRLKERKYHTAAAIGLAAAGVAVSTFLPDPTLKMLALSVAAFGVFGALPVFWTMPTAFLSGAAAAGGIAIINSIGNLSGFVGPYLVGYIKDRTGGFDGGLLCLAAFGLMATLIVLLLNHDPALEEAPKAQARPAE